MKKPVNVLVKLTFAVYLIVVIILVFFRHRGYFQNVSMLEYALMRMNWIPFKTIGGYIKALFDGSMNLYIPVTNLTGNLFMFLPLGFYLPLLFQKIDSNKKCLLISIAILLVIEVLQILTKRGSFDIDDFILNVIGVQLGFWLWKSRLGRWVSRIVNV